MKKSIDNLDWVNSWTDFVESVAALHSPNLTAEELTRHYIGTEVRWRGEVQDVQLDNDVYTFVGIQMPYYETKLSSGRVFRAQRLLIPVPEDQVNSWADCRVGMTIEFRAFLGFSNFGDPSVSVYEPTGAGRNSVPASLKIFVISACSVIE